MGAATASEAVIDSGDGAADVPVAVGVLDMTEFLAEVDVEDRDLNLFGSFPRPREPQSTFL